MATVYIAYDVDNAAIKRVKAFLRYSEQWNPDWAGADIKLKRDRATWVDARDEIAATNLLGGVYGAIDGHEW